MDMPAYTPNEACVVQAAAHYQAHPDLIHAVLRTEGGRPGVIGWNKDGSFDMGPMRINSVHLPELAKWGIDRIKLTNDECLNIHIGTYYLQKSIQQAPHFWHGVGAYHSKTPSKNRAYQFRVAGKLTEIRQRFGLRYGQ